MFSKKSLRPAILAVSGFFLLLVLLSTLTACGSSNDNTANNEAAASGDWSKAVAATVDGTDITEEQINDYVAQYRKRGGYEDDAAWATFLDKSNITPEAIRNQAISYFTEKIAVENAAKEAGVSVSDDDVQAQIDQTKALYGYTDDADGWNQFLESMGSTEDEYKEDIKFTLLENALADAEVETPEPTETDLSAQANADPTSWAGKRSYNIVFTVDDATNTEELEAAKQKAQDAINQLMADGTVTEEEFAALGDELVASGDAGQASDVGWSGQTSFIDSYANALETLKVGEMTQEPVQSDYGYHLILCTEQFNANEDGTITVAAMPEDLYETLKEQTVETLKNSASQSYIQGLVKGATIKMYAMPEGLPYIVDMSLSTANANVNANTDATVTTTTATDNGGTVVVEAAEDEAVE